MNKICSDMIDRDIIMKKPQGARLMIGLALKREREMAGLTQQQLADLLNTTHQQIAKYENNIQDMTTSRLMEIAKVLGIMASKLLDEEKGPEHEN